MSDPFRDAAARKRSDKREKIRQEYTPIVLWVKTPGRTQDVINYTEKTLKELPAVTVATKNTPYKYAKDGVLREENADGNDNAND